MMSESVTVTVQDGSRPAGAAKPGDPGQGSSFALRFNPLYFRSIPGLLKIAQLILGIICLACGSPALYGGTHWFLFVASTAFLVTIVWCVIYLISLREALKLPINWILSELINYALYTLLYFTAFVAELASAFWAKHIVAGVFGLLNNVAYAASTYFLYLEWQNSRQ
ncbi:uncharacterized protein LOC100114912 isoform X2 [Nasonia vitripennis]|uniref:MARVEL domain-containing protein n=1 Tax=Nasonia vitripennis TaxID=7425 RepID=A0A7M7J463_NASVI|nr:uncharacterized protein LOC100114912 isoform X2 [Nasonia vitripennis]